MAMPPGGPMEVVFSFDTTGSMSQVLDEVKARVNDIVQRLQADIPGFRVGIIAHGDYCDAEHFYDIKHLDLTDNVADVVTFVNDTEGTGGGDIPECYELALLCAKQMTWTRGSRRVLVVIGDSYPHDVDYELNKLKLDWTEELRHLINKGVRVYGVQYQDDAKSTSFFSTLAQESGGQHLKLADMSTICQVIMAICYREHGVELFENYEAELRANNQRKIAPDLECVFGALRKETSTTSSAANDLAKDQADSDKRPMDTTHDDASDTPPSSDSGVEDSSSTSSKNATASTSARQQLVRVDTKDVNPYATPDRRCRKPVRLQVGDVAKASNSKKAKKYTKVLTGGAKIPVKAASKLKVKGQAAPSRLNKKEQSRTKSKAPTAVSTSRRGAKGAGKDKLTRPKREFIPDTQFKYFDLPWTTWHPAATPGKCSNLTGDWTIVGHRGSDPRWRRDLLDLCVNYIEKLESPTTVFELGIRPKGSRRIQSVYFRSTNINHRTPSGVFGATWYTGLFRNIRMKLINAVSKGCKVYIRWAVVQKETRRALPRDYDYPWLTGRQTVTDGQKI